MPIMPPSSDCQSATNCDSASPWRTETPWACKARRSSWGAEITLASNCWVGRRGSSTAPGAVLAQAPASADIPRTMSVRKEVKVMTGSLDHVAVGALVARRASGFGFGLGLVGVVQTAHQQALGVIGHLQAVGRGLQ